MEPGDPLLFRKIDAISSIEVQVTSEEARLTHQHLPTEAHRQVLERLFIHWGLREPDAESVVDALMDFVDEDNLKNLKGAESADYKSLGLTHRPANRPFQTSMN